MDGGLAVGAAFLWVVSLGWLVATWTMAVLQPLRRRRAAAPAGLPAVSMIVPTSSVESERSRVDRLATLESLRKIETGESEILVCFDRETEAANVAATGRVRSVAAAGQASANAKVDAMVAGVTTARHDLLLFSDDDVQVDREHFARMLAQLHGRVGLVSAAAVGTEPENLWGELELFFMNCQFARMHLMGDFLDRGGVLGKAILLRRADLAQAGGLAATGRDCCEDAALTRSFAAVGHRTALSDTPVHQPIGRQRFLDVWRRHRRWMSCRRKYTPGSFACEALFSAPVACLAGAVAFGPLAGVLGSAVLWCTIDCGFILVKRWHFGVLTPFAWLVREAIFLPLWTSALLARTVRWYGRLVPVAG